MIRLGVNIDHVATLRQARRARDPDPVHAAVLAELGGAAGITVHLRSDRRHIQERDVEILRRTVTVPFHLVTAATSEATRATATMKPDSVTLVPERREEVTTEGGLDVRANRDRLRDAIPPFRKRGIAVSLFIDPAHGQIEEARRLGVEIVEIHTGAYANAAKKGPELRHIVAAARAARRDGMIVAAGHGLTLSNVRAVAAIPEIGELNIGHSIVSRALSVGMARAVREMKEAMRDGRRQ